MKTKKKRELTLRILPRRNPLVDELAWKHGSWCITPKWNKLKMDNLSKVMYKTYEPRRAERVLNVINDVTRY